ncbi:hypothetical protein DESUT3_13630 [Desulfuromonas versatilis]|uniref:Nucleotidyl transferase AbiEii/AbiGii toxin family protein n=1 Tax=Desulfuromonas versatilis TaxID=2802975 RepID=A0ABM8HUH3_9BACT|nr:nucleotidyl transferase AbiEii/AbiGii toxin family protein [Desulfuromonas versatilis]BCR04294.1 hypothetical protein DESUT3_13630 [Desulfuromonas versatilis]
MISQDFITEWRDKAPWLQLSQVEQDLVICRALVAIFNHPVLKETLAFRGGTAMFKLHMPAARYSEDIDLVQVEAGGIGPLMDGIREALTPWLGAPKWKQSQGRVTFRYRFESEEGLPMSLKVEINSREHFSVFGFRKYPFAVDSRWFSGAAEILTYDLEELLGTKLRALYQRKKGRDLFDLWHAFNGGGSSPDAARIIVAFLKYMDDGGYQITRAQFEQNLLEKRDDPQFAGDIRPLLTADAEWDFNTAFDFVMDTLISKLPG